MTNFIERGFEQKEHTLQSWRRKMPEWVTEVVQSRQDLLSKNSSGVTGIRRMGEYGEDFMGKTLPRLTIDAEHVTGFVMGSLYNLATHLVTSDRDSSLGYSSDNSKHDYELAGNVVELRKRWLLFKKQVERSKISSESVSYEIVLDQQGFSLKAPWKIELIIEMKRNKSKGLFWKPGYTSGLTLNLTSYYLPEEKRILEGSRIGNELSVRRCSDLMRRRVAGDYTIDNFVLQSISTGAYETPVFQQLLEDGGWVKEEPEKYLELLNAFAVPIAKEQHFGVFRSGSLDHSSSLLIFQQANPDTLNIFLARSKQEQEASRKAFIATMNQKFKDIVELKKQNLKKTETHFSFASIAQDALRFTPRENRTGFFDMENDRQVIEWTSKIQGDLTPGYYEAMQEIVPEEVWVEMSTLRDEIEREAVFRIPQAFGDPKTGIIWGVGIAPHGTGLDITARKM